MLARFPRLDDYEEAWPLNIMLIMILKNTSAQAKSAAQQNVVQSMKEAAKAVPPAPARSRRSKQ